MSKAAIDLLVPTIDQVRVDVNRLLNPQRKAALGQFMTPDSVADFMAALFSKRNGTARILDAGAGVGSLTDAFLRKWGSNNTHATAYEIDHALSPHLKETLHRHRRDGFTTTVVDHDFIQDAVYRIKLQNRGVGFTHAILNPPYKKFNSDSIPRALLRKVGLETVNLYTGFLGLALELMADGGELVAIIPRSFCNGLYYRAFRE